jgi:hypothetical protein
MKSKAEILKMVDWLVKKDTREVARTTSGWIHADAYERLVWLRHIRTFVSDQKK